LAQKDIGGFFGHRGRRPIAKQEEELNEYIMVPFHLTSKLTRRQPLSAG
jgi:hypothetical protein